MKEREQETAMPAAGYTAVPGCKRPGAWGQRDGVVALALALIVLYAFLPALNNSFVPLIDDDENFLKNPNFHGLGAAHVKWAWTTFLLGVYQPLAWLLYEAQFVFCQLNPRGYHLTSLVLQVVNAVVLYVLTLCLLRRCVADIRVESPWIGSLSAALATALFIVHPLRVEVVAWASCQPYLPCALFSMLSVIAYLSAFPADSTPRWGWLWGSFLLFVVAILFKTVAVGLPAVLLMLDVYPLRRVGDGSGRRFSPPARRVLWEKVPFGVLSLLFMGLAIVARPQSRFPMTHYAVSEGIAQACYAVWFYIFKTVVPFDLIIAYPLPDTVNWLELPYSAIILCTLALSSLLFVQRRRYPGVLAAWLSYLVILAPNSGLIRNNTAVIASDRYSYTSMLGLAILAAGFFYCVGRTLSQWRPGIIGGMVLGAVTVAGLVALTREQCRKWRDTEVLLTHALAHGASASFAMHTCLADVVYARGNYDKAVVHYKEALRLNPDYDQALNNLGSVLFSQGKYDEAAAHFTHALRVNPANDKVHVNMAKILSSRGKYEEAEAHYAEAVRLDPRSAQAHNKLGAILHVQRKYESAAVHFAEAVRLDPEFADAHNNLGVVLQNKGDSQAAEAHFTEAVRLRPGYADAHNSLGLILSRRRRYAEAEAHLANALHLDPGNGQAHYNLGSVFVNIGRYEAARAQFAEAIRLQPSDPKGYNASAMLMAACPEAEFRNGKGAIRFATRACALTNWKNPIVLDTLAAAQAEAGDFEAAVKSQKNAIALVADIRQKDDFRSRLALYQRKKTYRYESPRQAQPKAHP